MEVRFEPGELNATAVPIFGAIDADADGDSPYAVAVRCASDDARFDGAEARAGAVNVDVPLPRISKMHPTVAPYIATQVTIVGENLRGRNLTVSVGDVVVSSAPILRTVLVNASSERIMQAS